MYQILGSAVQGQQPAQKEGPDLTGIPKQMKLEFEERSGSSLDDVRVQYNSEKPAQLQALAYTQGSRIYIAPGQERHLKHELVHVIQQKQGRVRATARVNGMAVNDEERLEREADLGQIPVQMKAEAAGVVQRKIDDAGHLVKRSDYKNFMYDTNEFRWYYYLNGTQGTNKGQDETTVHHIIPYETLEKFWNVIVNYYPDLWGNMIKDILDNVNMVLTSDNTVYRSNYQNALFPDVGRPVIDQEIDRETKVLIDRAFNNNLQATISQGRPRDMGGLNDLLDTVYTWMPGNLVIGPTDRSDDLHEGFDAPAVLQKGLQPVKKEYTDLNIAMINFTDREDDHKRRKEFKRSTKEHEKEVEDAFAMEVEAREIIGRIVSLLAGQPITNDTVWDRDGNGQYASRDPNSSMEVSHNHFYSPFPRHGILGLVDYIR